MAQLTAFEAGVIKSLDNKYFNSATCRESNSQSAIQAYVLTLKDIAGIFVLVSAILGLSLVLLIIEVIIYRNRHRKAPFKICRRLNIFCGFRYDHHKPIPKSPWERGQRRSVVQLTRIQNHRDPHDGSGALGQPIVVTNNPATQAIKQISTTAGPSSIVT